jgi:transposase
MIFPDLCGRKFGTILVDLDAHQVIDLLSERSSQTSADWMREHPEIDYVSRDRGKDYAQGASEGAPQAVQVSDRFHLMKNFVEAIESEVSRCYRHLRQTQLPLPAPDLPPPDEWRQAPEAEAERKRLARLANKQERYAQAQELRRLGLSQKEIAQRLAVGVRTVQRWQGLETSEANPPRRKRRSIAGSLRCLRSFSRASGRTFGLAAVARNSEARLCWLSPDDVSFCESTAS